MTKVAVVTGGNKGIGLATVRGLCKVFDGDVYLTARDVSRGQEAVSQLKAEGLEPRFHQLDITDKSSAEALATFIKEKYGGLDVLVNNAAIAYKRESTAPVAEQADVTIRTNVWGTINVCQALFPLLRPGARVVNLSSFVSTMTYKNCSAEIQAKVEQCSTIDEVGAFVEEFVSAAKAGKLEGWPNSCYGVSKMGVSMLTPIQQKMVDPDGKLDKAVNSSDPGYVSTDMSSFKGPKTPEQGADTPIYLATLPPKTDIRGKFLADRTVKPWTG